MYFVLSMDKYMILFRDFFKFLKCYKKTEKSETLTLFHYKISKKNLFRLSFYKYKAIPTLDAPSKYFEFLLAVKGRFRII